MRQVLFTIPIFGGIKVFGYGMMLFLAFVFSTNLAAWRAKREKLDPELLYDLALWVFIGGLTGIHQFVKIGAHAFLAGGAIVQRDVPPYVMVAGNPAVPHMVNAEGLKRRGFDEDQVKNVRNAYRILYRSDLKLAEATEKLRVLGETQPEVKAFVDFVTSSTRSIVR